MSKELNRREMIGRAAGVGFGVASVLKGQAALAQATAKAASNNFPPVPSWKTELRELAPNVFAYIQGGGPGCLNRGVSNAGLIVGDDHVMAIDSLGAPLHAKAFLAAIQKTARTNPFAGSDHASSRRPYRGFALLAADCRNPSAIPIAAGHDRDADSESHLGEARRAGRRAPKNRGRSFRRRRRSTTRRSRIITARCRCNSSLAGRRIPGAM